MAVARHQTSHTRAKGGESNTARPASDGVVESRSAYLRHVGLPVADGPLDLPDMGCYFFPMWKNLEKIPDVRDGLTREERVVLYVLHETQKERGDRNVPTAMLWGRVCEYFYISPEELSAMLARFGARK